MTRYVNNLDLNKNELQNARIQNLAGAPAAPVLGQLFFDTTTDPPRLLVWNGIEWTLTATRADVAFSAENLDGNDSPYFLDRTNHTGSQPSSTISDFDAAVRATKVDNAGRADVAADAELLDGNDSPFFLDRTNHSGTQPSGTISDFGDAVRAVPLNELNTPAGDINLGGNRIGGSADPLAPTDLANKRYVDAAVNGFDWKESVRAATTAAVALTGLQTIDGVALADDDRVLVKNQASGAENGIYRVAGGAWVRSPDADEDIEVSSGMATFVEAGDTNGNQQWVLTTDGPITLGTTALEFSLVFGQSSAPDAGAGLALAANAYNVGAGDGVVVTADAVAVDPARTVRKAPVFTVGDGAAVAFTLTHNLAEEYPDVTVYEAATREVVIADVDPVDANNVTVRFSQAPAAGEFIVKVQS